MIGILSDSHGDLAAFNAAYELLREKGARRFMFVGGRYTDLDAWLLEQREKSRGGREYSDMDFLADVTQWLSSKDALPRPPAFGEAPADFTAEEDRRLVLERFVRVPERDCLQYMDPTIPRKLLDMVGDALCCLVHDKNDLTREDLLNATIFIHGKESEPKVVQIGPRYFLTPGRMTGAAEQTCALLEKVDRDLRFTGFRLDGSVVLEPQTIQLGRGTKLSVK
ncbi:hypothetical protein [Hyalangium minutum]|uniref:Calcineurin-like phosphoesterase domain-containing protein n=1 Tax=Hyalangium minutum TaxID=394096 RepID=A0A085WPK0_9BACT|nr:hypothetical protein [Hyalangium minutum]KFE69613.1 hypothetical protein DB31_6588 [Hyalangium minutum]